MSSRRFATIRRAAQVYGVTHHTIRNYIKKRHFPVYRMREGACVDLDEVAEYLRTAPAARAKPGYGSFGPNAKVVDLSNVVEDFAVEDVQ